MGRRNFLKKLTLVGTTVTMGALGALFGPMPVSGSTGRKGKKRKKLRLIHITDTRVFEGRNCPEHMELFIEKLLALEPKPDFMIHTGDVIYDALASERSEVQKQWGIWSQLAEKIPFPIKYAIGDHDVFGNRTDKGCFGKQWAIDELQIPGRYYDFRKNDWHFIILDSVQKVRGELYDAEIDGEQKRWLKSKLSEIPETRPVMIISHIPILSASVFDWAKSENSFWLLPACLMHNDSLEIQHILTQKKNVKLCLSGHLHLLDMVSYDGIDYLGGGAVSGRWWDSESWKKTHCGFSVIDLFSDGSYKRTYHTYKWT
ncbi:hypothetical protein GWK08_10040 [Leptobacterium flavescens]|uniref:Calcineurin-like phosphoesterase domain-containing protein n=1 Tax=Leptobacterium flavescens TaxID=472055 RepID=A0A6P0UMU0_9FLAO|nr:metallophosphoesterase [Leptobacterium flavescens]NER13780.1 hypothetical protein [Leptobacterium flavescens]